MWSIAETWRVLTERWFRLLPVGTVPDLLGLRCNANEMVRRLRPAMHLVMLRDYSGPDPRPGLTDVHDRPVWRLGSATAARLAELVVAS